MREVRKVNKSVKLVDRKVVVAIAWVNALKIIFLFADRASIDSVVRGKNLNVTVEPYELKFLELIHRHTDALSNSLRCLNVCSSIRDNNIFSGAEFAYRAV